MSASAKPTEKLFKSFLAAVLAISLCPLMPADKAQAEEAGDSGEQTDAAQVSDEGEGEETDLAEGIVETDGSNADLDLTGENDGAEDEGALDDSNVALQAASDSVAPIVNWTKCGTCQWMIDSSGCLIVEPQSGETGELEDWTGPEAPWLKYKSSIVSAKIKKTVIAKTTSRAFYDCDRLQSVDLSGFDTSKVTGMSCMFYGCSSLSSLGLSSLDTSSVTDMTGMFVNCSSLSSLDLSGLDASHVTGMSSMFYGCSSLASLDPFGLDTSQAKDMSSMFFGCSKLSSLDLSSLDTSSVTDMSSMFYGCSSLASLDLSSFDASKVISMFFMFSSCSSLRSVALGGKFSFHGAKNTRQCSLPKLKGDGLTGFWENVETHELYAEDEIPDNVAATYIAQVKSEVPKTSISESMFTVDTQAKTYTGSPIKPSVSSGSL